MMKVVADTYCYPFIFIVNYTFLFWCSHPYLSSGIKRSQWLFVQFLYLYLLLSLQVAADENGESHRTASHITMN